MFKCCCLRGRAIKNAGRIAEIEVYGNPIYLRFSEIEIEDADAIVRIGTTHSHTREPLRVAHLIATGIVCRESKRQA